MIRSPLTHDVEQLLRIEDLITPEELQERLLAAKSSRGITDLHGYWIVGQPHELCQLVSATLKSRGHCEGCLRECIGEGEENQSFILRCRVGVVETIAPIQVKGQILGYLRGPQVLSGPIEKKHQSELCSSRQAPLDPKSQKAVRKALAKVRVVSQSELLYIARTVQAEATLFAQQCWAARLTQILADTVRRLGQASTPAEAGRIALDALEAIVGKVSMCIYRLQEDGRLHLYDSRREEPDAIRFIQDLDQGQAGWAALRLQPVLVRNFSEWGDREPKFLWPDTKQLPKSALTVPIAGREGRAHAVIQIFSTSANSFHHSDIEPVSLIGTSLLLTLERLKPGDRRASKRHDFEGQILELMRRPARSGKELFEIQQEVFQELAWASLKMISNGRSSIRIYDDRRQELRYSVVEGPDWTEKAKSVVCSLNDDDSAGAYAIKFGRPFFVENTKAEKHYKEILSGIGAMYLIPIYVQRRIVALLTVSANTSDLFTKGRRAALERMVALASGVLEHLTLVEESWLYEFERSFRMQDNTEDLCRDAVEPIRRMFGVRGCSIFLQYPEATALTLVASTTPASLLESLPAYEIGQGLTGWVAKHKKTLRLRNTSDANELKRQADDLQWANNWHECINYADVQGHQAYLAAPLLAHDQLIGVIRLTIKADGAEFQSSDEILIERVAARLAVWIDNHWLKADNEKRVRQLGLSVELGDKLTGTLELEKVCEIILNEGCRITGCNAGHIRHFDKGNLKLIKAVGLHRNTLWPERKIGEGMSGHVAQSGKGEFISDVSKHPWCRQVDQDAQRRHGTTAWTQVKSAVYFPLMFKNELVGTLAMHSPTSLNFGEEEKNVFTDLAHRSAMALKAALLFHEIESDLRINIEALARVRELGIRFAQSRKLEELLGSVLDSALTESHAEAGLIRILDAKRRKWMLRAAKDAGDATKSPLFEKLLPELDCTDDFVGQAYQSPKAIYEPDAKNNAEFQKFVSSLPQSNHRKLLKSTRSILIVPIWLAERCLGIIALLSKHEQGILPGTRSPLEALASYAAVAIENARLHEEQDAALRLAQPLALLGALLGGFLHEMRSGIHSLSARLEILLDPGLRTERIPRHCLKMMDQLQSLKSVCTDLEVFARVGQSVEFETVDVNEMIKSSFVQSSIPAAIKLLEELEQPAPTVIGNPVQLRQALSRLIENAIDAMPSGGVLRVQSRSLEKQVEVVVEDSGMGMDDIAKAHCLEPFYTTKNGTGLGLPVVFGIITHHSGKVELESAPGKGTTFRLIFPKEESSRHA